jgi:GT2 family glycosyltransferase
MFLVSISLLTYNGGRFIENCLKSVLAQTYYKIELLIIDNASQDNTVAITQEIISKENLKFPVRIIQNEKNFGFSGGHNLGIRESRGELILFLNQDVVLAPNFVEKAVDFFEKNKEEKIAALQPKLLRLDKEMRFSDVIDTVGLVMLKNRRIISRGQGQKDSGQFNKEKEMFGADGAAPVYKREALQDAKVFNEYFDEDFFMYKEDVDMAWRLRLLGQKTFYVPQVLAWHSRGAGESAATQYISIIKERRKIGQFAKFLSFRNQRLMQIKNELPCLFLKHLPWFIFKEIGAWGFVILFEPYTLKAVKELIKMAPKAFAKRKIIMGCKKVSAPEMGKWFV